MYLLATKDETFEAFRAFKARVERQSECKIKSLKTDGGGEYLSNEFKDYLAEEGIEHQLTFPDSPQQNGVAERYNRTLLEGVRSMLHGSGMSRGFWGEAVLCFNYTRNRTLVKGVAGDVTPYEAWTGHKPSVVHLRSFGSQVMIHVPDRRRKKLDPKATLGTFLGYALNRAGYRIWDGEKCTVVESRDVQFLNEDLQEPAGSPEPNRSLQPSPDDEEGVANPPQNEGLTVSLGLDPADPNTGRSTSDRGYKKIRVDGSRSQQKMVRFAEPDREEDNGSEDSQDRVLTRNEESRSEEIQNVGFEDPTEEEHSTEDEEMEQEMR